MDMERHNVEMRKGSSAVDAGGAMPYSAPSYKVTVEKDIVYLV